MIIEAVEKYLTECEEVKEAIVQTLQDHDGEMFLWRLVNRLDMYDLDVVQIAILDLLDEHKLFWDTQRRVIRIDGLEE